ncbi:MAG: hypothetical protein ACOCUI_04650 [bacterium]
MNKQEIKEDIVWEKYFFRVLIGICVMIVMVELSLEGIMNSITDKIIFYFLTFFNIKNTLHLVGFFRKEDKLNQEEENDN